MVFGFPTIFCIFNGMDSTETIKKYPFVRGIDWDGNHRDYDMTRCMPDGWQKPWFRETMLEDLKTAAIECGMDLDKMYLQDCKEKYGGLRLYFGGYGYRDGTGKFDDVVTAYEYLAESFCCVCGKPHVSMTHGWICPYCKDCWREEWGEFKEEEVGDVTISSYDGDKRIVRKILLVPYYDRIIARMLECGGTSEETNV